MPYRFASCLIALLALACAETRATCADGLVRNPDDQCVDDPSGQDGGGFDAALPDAGPPDAGTDAGPCGQCPPNAPHCLDTGAEFTCVPCTATDHCDDGELCSPDNQCVQCWEDEQCPGICGEAGTCIDCSSDADCGARDDGRTLCGTGATAGVCVHCLLDREDACGSTATCNLLTGECVNVGPGDQGACEPCTNDRQCMTGHRCIRMEFQGTERPTGHCLQQKSFAACELPYGKNINRASISGEIAQDYCGINEMFATCEAILAVADECTEAGECIVDGMSVPGAVCRDVGALENRCTYACAQPSLHCPNGWSCVDGFCNDP